MKPHIINKYDNFLSGWYFDNLYLCEQIIELHKNSKTKSAGRVGQKQIILDQKNSTDCDLLESVELYHQYCGELQKCVNEYIKLYPWCNQYSPWKILQQINIQHYVIDGGYYSWHSERTATHMPQSTRHLAFITYLNDVSDNGETEFYHQRLKIKPEAGLTIIFPCDWTFTHRGIPSPSQEKYIATGWFNYIDNSQVLPLT